jgi:CheY-like chemotaxis protein
MRVLIVEDDHFYATQLSELLADNGVDSIIVPSVEEALQTPLEEYAMVVVDVMLPNDPEKSGISAEAARSGFYSGVALCREIRKRGFEMPLLLLSGTTALGSGEDLVDWAISQNLPFVSKDEGPRAVMRIFERTGLLTSASTPRAFIVHGHDEAALAELKDYLQNTLKWEEPLVLREQPSRGKTVVEKFEEVTGRIDCVFVLLTPDDPGIINLGTNEDRRRARQNVIFELGFFYAQVGRKSGRIIVLKKGAVELPSDIDGIVWVDISSGIHAAGEQIRKEVAHLQ